MTLLVRIGLSVVVYLVVFGVAVIVGPVPTFAALLGVVMADQMMTDR